MSRIILFLFIIALCMTGCTKDVELIPSDEVSTETINGFNVKWRSQMTNAQKDAIRTILDNMILVKGGIFTMGIEKSYSSFARSDESPAHNVQLSDFYICKYEIMPEQVSALMNGSYANLRGYPYFTWDEWNKLLNLLHELTGITFSFPTEAQWEYAARGGAESKGYIYPGSHSHKDVFSEEVGAGNNSMPNELGIYNMADQFSEWCLDAYAEYTNQVLLENPCITIGKGHVVRGGCYISTDVMNTYTTSTSSLFASLKACYLMRRSTARSYYTSLSNNIGLRPVINIKQ